MSDPRLDHTVAGDSLAEIMRRAEANRAPAPALVEIKRSITLDGAYGLTSLLITPLNDDLRQLFGFSQKNYQPLPKTEWEKMDFCVKAIFHEGVRDVVSYFRHYAEGLGIFPALPYSEIPKAPLNYPENQRPTPGKLGIAEHFGYIRTFEYGGVKYAELTRKFWKDPSQKPRKIPLLGTGKTLASSKP